MSVDLLPKKDGFRQLFPAAHPARLALESQPDAMTDEQFELLYPILVRLAGVRTE